MPKTLTILIIVLCASIVLLGLGRQIATALQAGQRLDQAIDEVNKLQTGNNKLKEKLSQVQSYDFIEGVARDKLGLAKPGETIVVIPKLAISKVLGTTKIIEEIQIPSWQGWLKLFFK